MSVSFQISGDKDLARKLKDETRRAISANAAAVYAAAVWMADRVHENSPEATGALKDSFGVSRPNHRDKNPESVVEILAPYAVILDQRTNFVTAVYERDVFQAQIILADAFEMALRNGGGPSSIASRYPLQGSFQPRSNKAGPARTRQR